MKPDEIRKALAVVELTLKQWEAGTLTKLEGGEPITAKHVAMWRREIEELKRLL
jgi:cupin superfamily acireductone dioxygenase involved in methionine salvage